MITITIRTAALGLLSVFALSSCTNPQNEPEASKPLAAQSDQPKYLDHTQSIDERVDDLVARMTLEEKVAQMLNDAPAIERLGVPKYNWWSEALHGVARAGLATVFPQAIGLSATWDEPHMFEVATVISDEARAKHHNFVSKDKRFLYQGLTLWSPNINIFRDPRWGRGQETYGEDPYLTGRMAVQFIKGLQGDDPKYLKTVATVKHFAVHNGPEPERHEFDALADAKDLWETYLPQFEVSIKEGGAYSLMCAYNRYNGEAACSHKQLLQEILRDGWGFDGFIVSDCGAIKDIHAFHKLTPTPQASSARAVKAGTDLNCGNVYPSLVQAVEEGLITEAEIDVSVKRLFTARFKLGMFDPQDQVAYAKIPYSVVDSKKHKELALTTAQKSLVLLKNDNNTLPLSKSLKSLAVIGPNADQWLMLLGNYNGVPSDPVTPLRGIKELLGPSVNVQYAQGAELAPGIPMFEVIPSKFLSHDKKPGLQVEYFDNSLLEGDVVFTETHQNIDSNWSDKAPKEGIDDDDFSVRWRGELTPDESGRYQLGLASTCNTNVYLNGELLVNTEYHFRNEYGDPRTLKSDWVELKAGESYTLEVTAKETYADAQVQLVWAAPRENLKKEALQIARDSHAVVMFMGLTARMEGEEMDINVDGFRGGDRTKLGLPANQLQLIKEVHALGKPVVLVVLNGSALALNWEQENLPAILEAWYPGQAAGTAIASVLFGDYNPAGRLPVTYYRSVNDLPAFEDYNMTTQTYRFFKGEPLYPFGYGLSYSSFKYSDMTLKTSGNINDGVEVEAKITNTSKRDGDEVVQVYVSNKKAGLKLPLRELKAFERIHLKAGETRKLNFKLPAEAFTMIDMQGQKQLEPGTFEISIGGGQPEQRVKATSNVLSKKVDL